MINITNQIQGRTVGTGRVETAPQADNKVAAEKSRSPAVSAALSGAIDHMVKQGMPVDLDRVVSVRDAIADGQYPVDPMKIAAKILEFDSPVRQPS